MRVPKEARKDRKAVLRWLTEQALTMYTGVESENNFVLLHGATSAWALRQIVDYVGDR